MRNCYLKLEGDEPKPGESASEEPLQAVSGDSAKQTDPPCITSPMKPPPFTKTP